MKFKLLPLSAAVAFGIYPALGLAQGSNEQNTVQEIMVTGKYSVAQTLDTATGLGLTIQETPQSVSILTQERMKDQNIDTILEVVNNTVGVSSAEVDNVRNDFYSRGFQIDSYQIDGVPTSWSLGGDSGETVADTVIYERIEVVRGATGLLTGVGDPSASINLVRKHADSTELSGYVDVSAGRWDQKSITTDISSGLNESGSLRGRFVGKHSSGDSHENYYEDDSNVLYGVLEADLSADTLLRVGASYQHNDPKGATWGILPTFYSDGTIADWDVSTNTAMPWTRWETTNTNYFASINHTFNNGWQLIANYNRLNYETDNRLLYVSGTVDRETGGGLSAQRYRSDGKSTQDSFDLQLKGDFNLFNQTHEFVLGALHSDQSTDTFNQTPADQNPPPPEYDSVPVENFFESSGIQEPEWDPERVHNQDVSTKQRGYYAATRLSATDKLKFILGGRVATWLRDGSQWGTDYDYGNRNEFIPYAGALYDITDTHRVYASYTEIFDSQNSRDADGELLDPLQGKSFEVGLKSRFLNDRLHTTIAVFDIEQDNLAQVDTSFEGTPEQTTAYYPAQGTESIGFELEVVGQPIDGWNITAGYSQYTAEDAQGNDVNTAQPTKQFKLFTTYQFLDSLPGLTIGGGVNWQDETYSVGTNPIGQPGRLTQEAYSLVNLMARYEFNDALSVQFNAANVTDEKYYSQISYFSSYRYGKPRDYTLSLNYRFD
ncbi:TonB-dependent siderophore receptor [Marinimicrobium sp. ARAG 43.8]|uniref:TonB-dependent siderophore receptor n=1 Tax=Marinimicrobium sp. ARAG 43.8 TaxID=3418719 RepID=UPI003CECCD89